VSSRARIAVFAALVVVCLGAGAVAVVSGAQENGGSLKGSAAASQALGEARAGGRTMVMYRDLPGGKAIGKAQVALEPVDDRSAKPTLSALGCARVYYSASRGLCVAPSKRFTTGWRAEVFGADLKVSHTVELAGQPSRARVSPDGRYGSVTMFVAGHSYAAAGSFSTQTTLIDLTTGAKIADLEDFTVLRGGRQVTAIDVNYWGVTFARDGDTFYATLATGGKTYLIRGSLKGRTAQVIHTNVECPSLSPDGTRIAYKKRTDSDSQPWRATVLDLATMRETSLGDPRSFDDQIEWLDDDHVLYGRDGAVWSLPADGSGRPTEFLADADSPAVVRW